jgi:ParB family chromosome partitioning protein
MASIQSLASGRKDMLMLDPRIIQEKPGWNKRHETPEFLEGIQKLSESIAKIGVQEPLTIYLENDTVFLSNGHRRRRATLLAISNGVNIKTVPCMVAPKGATEAELKADQLSRNSGVPFSPLEVADVASELLGFGWSIEEIAGRACMTVPWLNKLLDLRAAPEPLKAEVHAGKVSATLAADLVARKGGQKAVEILAEAKERTGKTKITKKDLPKPPPILGVTPTSLLRAIVEADGAGDDEALNRKIGEARFYLERMSK